jgi:hypothetical protein
LKHAFENAHQFIRYIRTHCVGRGFHFYVTGSIPLHKDPEIVDLKLISRYGMNDPKWARCRKRRQGEAVLRYVRCGRFFILMATHGRHAFFREERSIRDVRKHPILCFGNTVYGSRKAGSRPKQVGETKPELTFDGGRHDKAAEKS